MTRNQLADAASPYLIQHKDNPVHWWQWSPEAIAHAKQTGKPILLSIGYAACHWCHVMAHESFEDPNTAQLMNELFVNIKVDREERPDIDQIYMSALHAMSQQGGWPLTMFLTSSGEPFWGGTYFPKTSQYGRPAFTQILEQVNRAYRETPEKIAANTNALREHLSKLPHTTSEETEITSEKIDQFAHNLLPHMDNEKGGMRGAPKFPNTMVLEMLWRTADRTVNENYRISVLTTLTKIYEGGIHDHLGGGFARYSVDENWLMPHFEKMLYDNAQLLELYALAWAHTQKTHFKEAAEGIVNWLQKQMMIEGKAFASSMDADSEGIEGKYYCWTIDEIAATLDEPDTNLITEYFGITKTGNWTDPHSGIATNILNTLHNPTLAPEQQQQLSRAKKRLESARSDRVPPARDDKILADWNGLMIHALARAATIFERPDWMEIAIAAFNYVIESMSRVHGNERRLAHSSCKGNQTWPGMASDYVQLTRAALALHQETILKSKPADVEHYIKIASQLTRTAITHHVLGGSYTLTLAADDAQDIILRPANTTDDPVPNPNSTMIQNLQHLAHITQEPFFREEMFKFLRAITPQAKQNPFAHASFLNAMDAVYSAAEITQINDENATFANALTDIPYLHRIVRCNTETERSASAHVLICVDQTCSLPLNTVPDFQAEYQRIRKASLRIH